MVPPTTLDLDGFMIFFQGLTGGQCAASGLSGQSPWAVCLGDGRSASLGWATALESSALSPPPPTPHPRTETAQFLHSLSTCLITRLIYPASDSKPGPAPRNSGPKGRQESNHYKLKAKAQVSKGAGGMGQWMKTVLCGNRALEMSSSPDPGRWELSLNRLPPHPGS